MKTTKLKTGALPAISEPAISYENGQCDWERQPHDYYDAESYIRRTPDTGQINLRTGERAVYATEDFIVGLHGGMEHEAEPGANYLLYKCGFSWGASDMKNCADRMRHEFGGGKRDIWSMNKKFVLETWWWPLTTTGWGGWSIDLSLSQHGLTYVTIYNSLVAKAMEQVGKPVCHMYAGMFAGALSFIDQQPRESIEVQCYAMGNNCCKFLVGTEERVKAADFWQREGASANEILSKLTV